MVSIREWLTVGEIEEGRAGESALLRAGRAGDPAALEQLLALHKRPLLALCHGMLGHVEDAEDAVGAGEPRFRPRSGRRRGPGPGFLRALRALPRFREEAAFRTWLYRIAVNVCLKWKASRPATEPWDEDRAGLPSGTLSPEAIALRRLRVMEALTVLPRRHRAVLLLKVLEGWSVAEIAVALRWNPIRVQNELSKARRALADWRRQQADEGDE